MDQVMQPVPACLMPSGSVKKENPSKSYNLHEGNDEASKEDNTSNEGEPRVPELLHSTQHGERLRLSDDRHGHHRNHVGRDIEQGPRRHERTGKLDPELVAHPHKATPMRSSRAFTSLRSKVC